MRSILHPQIRHTKLNNSRHAAKVALQTRLECYFVILIMIIESLLVTFSNLFFCDSSVSDNYKTRFLLIHTSYKYYVSFIYMSYVFYLSILEVCNKITYLLSNLLLLKILLMFSYLPICIL